MKCSIKRSTDEIKTVKFWRDVVAEGLATMTLIFFLILVIVTNNPDHYKVNPTHVGLFGGFMVFLLIEGYGPISGAHMNTAVTLGAFSVGHISFARAVAYIAVQFAGGLAGTGLAYLCTPPETRASYVPLGPNPLMTMGQSVLLEAALTFNLVFIALSCTDAKNRQVTMPGLPVGFAIGVGIMAGGTYTGGAMNPVAALGPALLSGDFSRYWVYVVGPCIGGILGAVAYTVLVWIKDRFGDQPKTNNEDQNGNALEKNTFGVDDSAELEKNLLKAREERV